MSATAYAGRVGGLAVALGVGAAVVTGFGCAVAWADPPESTSSSVESSATDSASTQPAATSDTAAPSPAPEATGTTVDTSTGTPTSTTNTTSSNAEVRSVPPGVVVATGGLRERSTTSDSTDKKPVPNATVPSAKVPPEAPRTPAPEVAGKTPPKATTGPGADAADGPTPQRTARSEGSTLRSSNDTKATMPGRPSNIRTGKIDAAVVVSDPVQPLSAESVSDPPAAVTAAAVRTISSTAPAPGAAVTMPTAVPTREPTSTAPDVVNIVAEMVSSVVDTVLSPVAATTAPGAPAQAPALWTLAAFARREIEQALALPSPTVNPPASPITNGLVIDTPTLSGQSMDPALTGGTAPLADVSVLTANPQPDAPAAEDPWTGEPSFVHQFFVGTFRVVGVVGKVFGAQSAASFLAPLLTSDSPPWFTTLGLNVQRSEFEGMPVWTLQSPGSSSGKAVVGLHGGGFVYQPNIFNWLDYAAMARDTGATVVVPIYPLAPQGSAATVVPQTADFLSAVIEERGSESVSVYGDSAGGGLALAAVQELVRRGAAIPARMVLISPALDATLSDPASQTIDDPVLNYSEVQGWVPLWAGDLDLADPRVSPLFGSLAGLPPTVVYSGSLDLISPQVLRLRERALAEGADFTFVLRKGLIHDWAILPPLLLPEASAVRPAIYRQLLGTGTPTLTSQSMDPAITGLTGAPLAGVSVLTANPQPDATAEPATFTGEPSLANQVTAVAFRALRAFTDFTTALFGVDTATPIAQLLTSDSPPWFTTLGLNVQRGEFEAMPVYTLQPANPSGKYVVGIHGGGYILEPNIFNWIDYAAMARNTGATVIVPIYPLAPQGTAATVVPVMADLISSEIDQHGAENVSVYGDSAGGAIGLAAVQELVRRGDPVPSHLVLISPSLDLTFSNPAIQFIDDPILTLFVPEVQQWAGDLDLTDPLVSPLYGSLAGLPPTAVYSGSLDLLAPDVLVLQDKALATPGADFTFTLRKGLIHDWAIFFWLPEAIAAQPEIYSQLGLQPARSSELNTLGHSPSKLHYSSV